MNLLATPAYKILNRRFATAENIHEELYEHHHDILRKAVTPYYVRNDVEAYIVPNDIDTPYCIVKTTLPMNALVLFEYLAEDIISNLTDWSKVVTDVNLVEKISDTERIVQVLSKIPFLKTREDLFYQYCHRENSNTFYELSTGVIHEKIPNYETDKVHCKLYFCSKEIISIDKYNSQYIAIWQHNPGGILEKYFSAKTIAKILLKNMIQECETISAIMKI